MIIYLKIICVLLSCSYIQAKNSALCVHHETCSSCLAAALECSWCTDRTYDMRRPRCLTKLDLIKANCRENLILINKVTKIEYTENRELHDFTQERLDAVQIKPQKVKFNLRKGRTETVKMIYRPAKNYPFDLYYLMDLTYSMRDDKETLLGVGNNLASSLYGLSENYRIGFGSFGDKNTVPYIIPGIEDNPCAPEKAECKPLYSYRHSLSLTKDVNEFIKKVNASEITGNLDTTEGGMDALMQILVCPEQIGWGNRSRKIVVFATDAKQHFAGDGRLAGVVTLNDKQCHLNDVGEYTASLEFDYPSLEQIYRELVKMKVNIIFAVTKDLINHYNRMNDVMDDISSVGQLAMDSSNILQLVEHGYQEFAKKATFLDDSADYIKMTYRTTCGGKYEEFIATSKCDNIEQGKDYEFYIDVTLLDYPDNNVYNHKVRIEESSIGLESLEMDIDIDHGCPCLAEEVGESNSTLCGNHGEIKCGMCICDEGWTGKVCECNLQSYASSKTLENQCREPYEEDGETKFTPVCSNSGECLCGQCYCNVGLFGKFCNCKQCPIHLGMDCGGADHGSCTCSGRCECQEGWKGESCDCSTSEKTCTAPNSEKVCSGRGICECDKCTCEPGYFGVFCESSIGGENGLCIFYEACVQCIVSRHLGEECTEFDRVCKSKYGETFDHRFVSSVEDTRIKCMAMVKHKNEQCIYNFIYDINKDHETLLTIKETTCPPVLMGKAGYLSLLGIIVATLLLGLVGICCYVHYLRQQDKREFAEFERRVQETQYDFDSPIYKSPITEYRVPQKDEDGVFEMTSSPIPKSPTKSYTSPLNDNGQFSLGNYAAGMSSPKSPTVVHRPPFKTSDSIDSSNIVYQTSSVLARDITNESPTTNTSSIIYNRFPVDPSHFDSTITTTTSTTPTRTSTNNSLPKSPLPQNYSRILEEKHHIQQITTTNEPSKFSKSPTLERTSDNNHHTQYITKKVSVSPTFQNNSNDNDDGFHNARTIPDNSERGQYSQNTSMTKYFVNGQEVDHPHVHMENSPASLAHRSLSPTSSTYRPVVKAREQYPKDDSSTMQYIVNGQEVENNPYALNKDSPVSTSSRTFRQSASGEHPITPTNFRHVDQPNTVVTKTIVNKQMPQKAEFNDFMDNDDNPLVHSETFIRRTITESGQNSPISEKIITIRTSEQRVTGRQSELNSFKK